MPELHLSVEPPAHVSVFVPPYCTMMTNDLPATEAGNVMVVFALVVNRCTVPLERETVNEDPAAGAKSVST